MDGSSMEMADDEITQSLLEEYSIAEVTGEHSSGNETHSREIERESLRDAFSRFAKVIFHDISDSYPTDADVQCSFSLSHDMEYKDGDVVGLFRLGWRSPSEMIIFQPVPKLSNELQRDFQVQFQASDLPKDEGEIYQFCYISQNEVWGASVPFEFRRATAEELLIVEKDDIVIVRSQSAVAEDLKSQLATLRKELSAANAKILDVKENLEKVESENMFLKGYVSDLEKDDEIDRPHANNQALDDVQNKAKAAVRDSEFNCHGHINLISALLEKIKLLQVELASQAEEISKQNLALMEFEQHGLLPDLLDALREGKELAVREMRTALAENEQMRSEIICAKEEKDRLLQKLADLSEKHQLTLENQTKNEDALKARIEDLLVQLTQLTSESELRINEAKKETNVQLLPNHLEESSGKKAHVLQSPNVEDISSNMKELSIKEEDEFSNEIAELQIRLESVQNRRKEVSGDILKLVNELDSLGQTEANLLTSQSRMAQRIKCLTEFIQESQSCGNTLEASIHQRELKVAQSKMEEKSVCLESVQERRAELEKQMKELQEENSVLCQQEVEAFGALEAHNTAGSSNKDSETNEALSQFHSFAAHEFEIANLRERLRQAAVEYRILFREKLELEQQVVLLQEKKSNQ